MKATKLLFASILASTALVGLVSVLAWGQAAPARAEDALAAPAAPQTLPLPYLSDADTADAPYGTAPNVDGRIAPGEYAGADKVTFPGYGGNVEVFIRQDSASLFVAFELPDLVNKSPGAAPFASLVVDTNHDGGSLPQPDDFRLEVRRNGGFGEWQGTGSGWGPVGTVPTWTYSLAETMSGWSVEFRIPLTKLGVSSGTFKRLGFTLENGAPAANYYWPAGASSTQPASWGHLVSSSDWGTLYWKPGPWEDYAPSGLPDFDQMQVSPTYCGPFAAANSLWWFDSKLETPDHTPPTISDTYTLVSPYGAWDDHDPANVVSLTMDLGANYFGTNLLAPGTNVYNMYYGIQRYLRDHGLWDDYVVTLVNKPNFRWIAEEALRSEDVVLLLGFWQEDPPGSGVWYRISGHFVTVAGVDVSAFRIALSDPAQDWAEAGGTGRILSGTLVAHTPISHIGVYTLHNDAGNVSHDIYTVAPGSLSPGGEWWIPGYEAPIELLVVPPGSNPNPRWEMPPIPWNPGLLVHTEIEYALAVSPYDWKASGRWVEDLTVPLYGRSFVPFADFAPSGVPDFDQQQDNWMSLLSPQWSFCGPVAAANSLWWFDSKFEPSPITPPIPNDNYPLVQTYDPAGAWDDHDPLNVDNVATPWPPGGEFVEDLAMYFDTDGIAGGSLHAGTIITDVYNGLGQYLTNHNLRQGYVITMVNKPEFWWTAEEVEVSEDVILLLGFYAHPGAGIYERVGGHYVTVPGVDKQGGYVAFSDPYWDRMEMRLPPNEFTGIPVWTGRVGSDGDPLLGPSGLVPTYSHAITHTGIYTLHNDAANVSHDVYRVVATDSPGGIWGPWEYVTDTGQIVNFVGQNGGGVAVPPGIPVQTEVEWAVAVSPVADVFITKTARPTATVPGDWVTFTVAFGNAGSLPAENVVISDVLPAGLINASYTYALNYPGTLVGYDTFTWTVGTLHWKEGGIITITAQVDPTISDPQRLITNTACIKTTSQEQYQVPPLRNCAFAVLTVQTADLVVAKSATPTVLRAGERLTYTIAFGNAGPLAANNVVITDLLHMWLTSPSYSVWLSYPGLAPVPSGYYVWAMGPVPAGGRGVITVTARVSPTLSGGGTLPNAVSISTISPDRDPTNNSASADVTVVYNGVDLQPPSGSIVENPGNVVTYTLALYNTGNVTDTYGITGTVSGLPWSTNWPATVGPVAGGGNAPVVVTVQIPPAASGWSQAIITATSQGDGSKQDSSILTTYAQSGTITHGIQVTPISPTVSGDPGSTVCFTLIVTNTGNVTDTVNITHTFPLSWTVTFAPLPPYMLPPGGSQAVYTCIAIPSGATGGGTETGDVIVSSQGDPAVHADVNVTVHVGWRFIYLPLVMRNY